MDSDLEKFLNDYKTPSFGSLSKREIDLRVFELFIKKGIIKKEDSIFTLISKLKISRAKARALIYDYNLREKDEENLKMELKLLLKEGAVEKNSTIKIEIDNPYLIDYIRDVLKRHRIVSDGSFKPEILVLSMRAYGVLLEECLSAEEQKEIYRYLYGDSLARASLKGIVNHFLKKYTGDDVAEQLLKLGNMVIEQKGTDIQNWVSRYITNVENVEE